MDDLLHHRTVPEYNTRAVVNRTGVPADTFRAWERRHGLPRPARTEGNHRLYSERDIAIISWLKRMTDEGVSISHAVGKARRRLEPGRTGQTDLEARPTAHPSDFQTLRDQLFSAITNFDTRRANGLIEEVAALIEVESLFTDILQPVLTDIGDKWLRGEVTVSMEHFASAFCMRKLSTLFNSSQPEIGDYTILCACVEGEQHEIGLMMTSVLLSRAGFRVIYLGANLPGDELIAAVQRIRPEAVALSSSTEATHQNLVTAIASLRREEPNGNRMVIGFGGWLFEREPAHKESIDAEYLGANARIAHRRLTELMSTRRHKGIITI